MTLLVRKIEMAKWRQRDILGSEEPSADAITNCMKTMGNTLSVWLIESEAELEEAILAMVAESAHFDAIDVISLPTEEIEKVKLTLSSEIGKTPYKNFSSRHRNIAKLTYSSLGSVSKLIIESIRRTQKTRYTRDELKTIMLKGLSSGKISWDELKPDVQNKFPKPPSS